MRILVYGAGNMGGLYAALLQESGQDVSILARGARNSRPRSASWSPPAVVEDPGPEWAPASVRSRWP